MLLEAELCHHRDVHELMEPCHLQLENEAIERQVRENILILTCSNMYLHVLLIIIITMSVCPLGFVPLLHTHDNYNDNDY